MPRHGCWPNCRARRSHRDCRSFLDPLRILDYSQFSSPRPKGSFRMRRLPLARQRQIAGAVLVLGLIGIGLWVWSPGLAVIWGPSASKADIAAGKELFEHEWQPNDPKAHGDGLGPVFNAKSCASCHF